MQEKRAQTRDKCAPFCVKKNNLYSVCVLVPLSASHLPLSVTPLSALPVLCSLVVMKMK